jgi:hypothetical protein
MKKCTVYLKDSDHVLIDEIFLNEPDFKPLCKQDFLIVHILKQIQKNSEDYTQD